MLSLIQGQARPAIADDAMVICECQSRTFVKAVTGLRVRQGKIIHGPGAVTVWSCAQCGKRQVSPIAQGDDLSA